MLFRVLRKKKKRKLDKGAVTKINENKQKENNLSFGILIILSAVELSNKLSLTPNHHV